MKDEKGLLDYLTPDQQKGYVKSLAILAEPLIKRAYEKGYEKALRDVIDHMDLRFVVVGIDERDGNVRTAIDAIEAFAAERGIDLEDTK